ncbi:MAG: type I restriction enzyme HsdR N-terminal domain-containing protein [Anaerolineae bacterium]|nr:type I restriction enzyme HsdR N-terminal domain-containing protein [Anaerolineae bacterium]
MTQRQYYGPMLQPEEQVKQYVFWVLQTQLGYPAHWIGKEFPIKMGSDSRRADIVVFHPNRPQTQENIRIIIECKRVDGGDKRTQEAIQQLFSYVSACLNAEYGVVASKDWLVYQRRPTVNGLIELGSVSALPNVLGNPTPISYRPYVQAATPQIAPPISSYSWNHQQNPIPPWSSPVAQNNGKGIWLKIMFGLLIAGLLIYWGASNWESIAKGFNFASDDVPRELDGIVVPPEMLQTLAAQTQQSAIAFPVSGNLNRSEAQVPTAVIRQYMEVTGQRRINVRLADSTESPVVAVLNPGQHVLRIGQNLDQTWTHVELEDGANGWVASYLLEETEPATLP